MKACGDIGCGSVHVVGRGEGLMEVVEMSHRALDRQVHGAQFADQLLKLLCGNSTLRGGNVQKGSELRHPLWGKSEGALISVHNPAQDLLGCCPVPVPLHGLFDADQVLSFSGEGGKNLFEVP